MTMRSWATALYALAAAGLLIVVPGWSQEKQPPDKKQTEQKKEPQKKEPPFGKGGKGGKGGFGPMGGGVRKVVKQFDKDGDGRLNTEERKAARKFLEEQGAGRGGFGKGKGGKGGFGKGKGGKGPGGFGGFLAKPLLEATDADKDGKLSQAELVAGVKKFFTETDKDKKGALTEEKLAEGINRIFPRPGGGPGRPPGGGPNVAFGPGNALAGAVVKRADTNKDGKVTLPELTRAAEVLFTEIDKDKKGKLEEPQIGAGITLVMPPPQFGGRGRVREPGKPGPKVKVDDVKSFPKVALYEPTALRTVFLEFENADWEAELAVFKGTDVEVPATLIVDGKRYANVGVHFRGMSSYMMTPAGSKRSLNISLDFVDKAQRLYGSKTLNLLNSNDDPSFLHSVLYSHISRAFIPAPKANLIKVVINGESWGVYVNQQQFDKEFLRENFNTTKGTRWKVRGSPGGGGGLEYLGENVEDYKRRFQIKGSDDTKAWQALVTLCRTLNKTPPDKLEAALRPMLDIDGALKFLALDVALINNDGYWVRASDYSIYLDRKGKFHLIPHDMNETFSPAMSFGRGPGGGGGGGRGVELDPLVALTDARKPLRSKLLAVPSLQTRYLEYVRAIARDHLDWEKVGPLVTRYRTMVEKEVEADTRKLYSLAAFKSATGTAAAPTGGGPGQGALSLKSFVEQRRQFLLNHPAIKKLDAAKR